MNILQKWFKGNKNPKKNIRYNDGYTYYMKDGELYACPSRMNGDSDFENEILVDDFAEPLDDFDKETIINLLK